MATYTETDLLLDMSAVFEKDAYIPKSIDLTKIIPQDYEDKEILTSFLSVVSNLVGVWLFQLEEIKEGFDPYKAGDSLISNLAEIVGFNLFDQTGVSLYDKRSQLTKICDSYKIKGSYSGLKGLLRGMGIIAEIKDMFAKDEASYEDFEQHIVRSWFVGNNPEDLAGYFKTPHFYVDILMTTLYNPGVVESLWNSLQEARLQSVVEANRPVNTWPYYNLLLEFYKSYSRGSLATTYPNIFSCFIDTRPTEDFVLGKKTYELSEVVDNAGFNVHDNNGEDILGGFSSWRLNEGIKLNYSCNRERLVPSKFLLGNQNEPRVTFFDSMVGPYGDWKNRTPEVNIYGSVLYDYRNICNISGYGYMQITPHTLVEQLAHCIDLVDRNIEVSYKQCVNYYHNAPNYSVGVNLRRSVLGDTSGFGTFMRFYVETVSLGQIHLSLFKVRTINPTTAPDGVEEASVIVGDFTGDAPPASAWHETKIIVRGLFVDVYYDGSLIIENLDMGSHLNGYNFGTYFSFYSGSSVLPNSHYEQVKDLKVVRLGNQDQQFNFDENTTVLRQNFGTYSADDISLYGKTWVSYLGAYNISGGRLSIYSGYSFPLSKSYIDLVETNLLVSFKFSMKKTGYQTRKSGCNILQSYNTDYNEHIKVFVDRSVDPNGILKICRYRLGLNGETEDQFVSLLASTTLSSEAIIDYGDVQRFNKMEIYVTDDTIRAVVNDNYEVSYTGIKYLGNYHTRLGFYASADVSGQNYSLFSSLQATRYGLENYYNAASELPVLSDSFLTSGELLKNHTPDLNFSGDFWHDPQDAFITGTDGSFNYLTSNTTDMSKILQNYINIPFRDFEVDFWAIFTPPQVIEVGAYILKNFETGKGLKIYLHQHHVSGGFYLRAVDDYNNTEGVVFGIVSPGLLAARKVGFRARVERCFSNRYYPYVTHFGLGQNYFKVTLTLLYEPYINDVREVYYNTVIVQDAGYSSALSLWWNSSYTTMPLKIDSVKINPILIKAPIYSLTEKYFGDAQYFPRFVATSGEGLLGEYFDSKTFTNLVLSRTDATVYFEWGLGSPDPLVATDTFSVRWTGYVIPQFTETYTFLTHSDDGVRLWVNDVLVIDNWTDHALTLDRGTIDLKAGVAYKIQLDFYENGGNAVIILYWLSKSLALEVIPQSRLYLPSSPIKGHHIEATVPVNEAMEKTSEVALFAGDGRVLLGGITYPYIDKNSGEKLSVSGDIDYQD